MHLNPHINRLLMGLGNPSLPGIDLSLDRMWQLLERLGNPQDHLPPTIHIAGTNGKGSTIAFLRAIYEASGHTVHAYISPHLIQFNERIVLAGRIISDARLTPLLERVSEVARDIPVTFFEATTAAAFLAFREHPADVLLLETGLGGRLDATNVIAKPLATVLTPIDYDHMEFLGNSLAQIATEKAGILKRGVPCYVGTQMPEAREVIKRIARERQSPLHMHGRAWSYDKAADGIALACGKAQYRLPAPSLAGDHQYHNAALATVVALGTLRPTIPIIRHAVGHTYWPGRMQRLSSGPLVQAWGQRGPVYLDGGHNPSAARELASWVAAQHVPVTLVLGMMKRKDIAGFLKPLKDCVAHIITLTIPQPDAASADDLATAVLKTGMVEVSAASSMSEVAAMLGQCGEGALLVAGSLYLAGEILKNHG